MSALIAVDPGEATLRIAAGEEAFDDIDFDAPPEPATRFQFGRMPGGALVERARARLARPVDRASGHLGRMRARLHDLSNAFRLQAGARGAQPLSRVFVSRRKHTGRDESSVTKKANREDL